MRRVLHLVFILLTTTILHGQSIKMEKLTASDGLFSNRIFSTFRDNQGYLWLAGINGVAKYNGHTITNYSAQANADHRYIQGERFYRIIQDSSQNIWVCGDLGIHQYDKAKDTFRKLTPDSISNIRFIELLNDSTLSFYYKKHHFCLNSNTGESYKCKKPGRIKSSITDANGISWKATTTGYIIYNHSDTLFHLNSSINDICVIPNGDLYLGTNKGLLILPKKEQAKRRKQFQSITFDSKPHCITNNSITSLSYYKHKVWIGTLQGLNVLHLKANNKVDSIQHIYNQPNQAFTLLNNQINQVNADKEGIVWISTYGGVNKVDPSHLWFSSFKNNPNNQNSIHDNNIFPISGDTQGNVWFGSFRNGLSKYNTRQKLFTTYDVNEVNYIRCLCTDSHDNTWVSALDKLLLADGDQVQEVSIIDQYNNSFQYRYINAISQHPNGHFWMGIDKVIVELEKVGQAEFKVLQVIPSVSVSLITIFIDKDERIWCGTINQGIILITEGGNKIIRLNTESQDVLASSDIQAINQDSFGNMWFGSTNGLYTAAYDSVLKNSPENIKLKGFFKEDGLSHNYVSSILADKQGVLWLGSWKGIMKYDPNCANIGQFIPYSFNDGLVDEKYNRRGAYFDITSNTYYFGSVNGVNFFNPIEECKSELLPELLISELILNSKPIDLSNLNIQRTDTAFIAAPLVSEESVENLQVRFGSSSHKSPNKQVVHWQLIAKDGKSTYTREKEIFIENLKPGKYTLKIQISNIEGQYGKPLYIPLIIKTSYGLTLLIILLLILVISISWFLYTNKRRPSSENKSEVKYEYSKLTDDKSSDIANRLQELMEKDKPYVQPDLTADALAKLIGVSSGELSQILNENLQTKFYEYINKHRVDEFIRLLHTADADKLTITALSEKSGFSSKSTFYRAFKNEKGITPAQFAKNLKRK